MLVKCVRLRKELDEYDRERRKRFSESENGGEEEKNPPRMKSEGDNNGV